VGKGGPDGLPCGLTKWKEAGLLRPSVLKAALATLERSLVVRELGCLAGRESRHTPQGPRRDLRPVADTRFTFSRSATGVKHRSASLGERFSVRVVSPANFASPLAISAKMLGISVAT